MNYSRNIKKASIGRRILISWVVVAIIFFFTGFRFGIAYSDMDNQAETTKQEAAVQNKGGRT